MTDYTVATEGEDHINIDISSSMEVGRTISMHAMHDPIDSVLGFTYSSFKAIDKYLKLINVDLALFRDLVSSDKKDASDRYAIYVNINGATESTPHHKCILLFLMWERAMLDDKYYAAVLDIAKVYNTKWLASYNAKCNKKTMYDKWLSSVLIELAYSVANNRIPNLAKFANSRINGADVWYQTIPSYHNGNDILATMNELNNKRSKRYVERVDEVRCI